MRKLGHWITLGLATLALAACSNNSGGGGGTGSNPSATRTKIAAPVGESPTPSPQRGGAGGARVVSVVIMPAKPTAKDGLKATVQLSAGALPEYQWYINGNKLTGQIGPELQAGQYKKDDEVEVGVVASAGPGKESPESRAKVKIGNQFPQITSTPGSNPNNYQVSASDPDGDKITFKLDGAPPNMTISPTGTLSWPPPYEPGKQYTVKVIAEDTSGAQAIQVIPITVPGGA